MSIEEYNSERGARFFSREYLWSKPEPYKLYLAIVEANSAILNMMESKS